MSNRRKLSSPYSHMGWCWLLHQLPAVSHEVCTLQRQFGFLENRGFSKVSAALRVEWAVKSERSSSFCENESFPELLQALHTMQQSHSDRFHFRDITSSFRFLLVLLFNFLLIPLCRLVISPPTPHFRILRLKNVVSHRVVHLTFSGFLSFFSPFAWQSLWCPSLHVYVSVGNITLIQIQHVPIVFFPPGSLFISQADLSSLSFF